MSILLFPCGSLRFRWNSPGQASLVSLRRSNSKFSWHFSSEKAKMKKDTRHSPALPQAKQHLDPRECVPLASSNSCWKEPIFSFPNRKSRDKTKTSSLQSLIPHSEHTQAGDARRAQPSVIAREASALPKLLFLLFTWVFLALLKHHPNSSTPTGAVELYWGLCLQKKKSFRCIPVTQHHIFMGKSISALKGENQVFYVAIKAEQSPALGFHPSVLLGPCIRLLWR